MLERLIYCLSEQIVRPVTENANNSRKDYLNKQQRGKAASCCRSGADEGFSDRWGLKIKYKVAIWAR